VDDRLGQDLERILPERLAAGSELDRQILQLHLDRYSWATEWASGRCVLDVACGVGYGADCLIRAGAREVLAVDVSPAAIEHAADAYRGSGVEFVCADLHDVVAGSGFGLVVSLETLEHLKSPRRAIRHLRSLLASDGFMVCSVPVTYSTDFNPHHLHDFTRRGFLELLSGCGLRPIRTLLQVHRYSVTGVLRGQSDRLGRLTGRDLGHHYLTHPMDLARRLVSLGRHGLTNRYLVVCAVPDDRDVFDLRGVPREVRLYG